MKKLSVSFAGVSTLVVLMLPLLVFAGPVVRSGESVSVDADQTVEGDLYAAGGSVTISGAIEGDLYAAGGSITINAPVAADVAVLGGTTQIHAAVADDVRVVGGEVTLADTVEGDVAVVGGVLRVLSTATIKGDILFLGGEVVIEGPVEGSLFGFAERMRIDSSIGGSVTVTVDQGLTLGDKTEILGDVTYKGPVDIVRGQNAVVVGNIQEDTKPTERRTEEMILIPFLTMLFGALALLLVMKPSLQKLVALTERSYGLNGLIGLAVLLGLPFVGIILTVSILGLFVGLILLAVYVALLLTAWIAAGAVVGAFVMRVVQKKTEVNILSVIAGVVLLQAVLFVPLMGPLLALAVFLIVLGGIATSVYKNIT